MGPSEFSSGNEVNSASGNNPRQSGGGGGGGGGGCGGGAFEENEMPSASCPAENSGAAYLAARSGASRPFESPTGALNIPRTGGGAGGGGGGNASGGSGASSVTGTWGGSSLASLPGAPNIAVMPCNPTTGADNQRVAMMRARSKKDSHNRSKLLL